MALVFFQTFGCQMNVADTDEFRRKIVSQGYKETAKIQEADLVIVNTCSVRENAEKKAIARITEFAKLKKNSAQLWVTGCMAQRLGENLKKQIPGVNLVIGAKEIDKYDEIINQYLPLAEDYDTEHIGIKTEVSDFISIMRGCDNHCAYCIVPYVRGNEISISSDLICESVKSKMTEGIKEITLLGQNVNSYNDNGIDFSDLLVRLSSVHGIERIRFTTSHPKDCSEKLIRTIAETPSLCHHIHLPLQAGSDRVLSVMNRKYSSKDYLNRIEMIHKYIPDADITTDLLVGFPSETDEEFEETLRIVKEVQYTTAFMFAYSVREGTVAAKFVDDVPQKKKLERLGRLIELQTEITRNIYNSMIGKEIEVMISGRQDKHDMLWMGQDNGCKRVLVNGDSLQLGKVLKAQVIRSSGKTLIVNYSD